MLQSAVPHLMTLADLSAPQIHRLLVHSFYLKEISRPWLAPQGSPTQRRLGGGKLRIPPQSLYNKTVALMFTKRSTRTRIASETGAVLLGGRALFLGKEDVQMSVNESLRDTAMVVGGMCEGIFARVGEHKEIEELAKYSPVPVLNALSSLWHPTQILADLLTLHEHAHLFAPSLEDSTSPSLATSKLSVDPSIPIISSSSLSSTLPRKDKKDKKQKKNNSPSAVTSSLPPLPPLTIAYIGDSSNVLHDMLVTYPRLGHKLRVASPDENRYRAPAAVWDRVQSLGCEKGIWWGDDPREAVKDADVVVTDTWVSMGQEAEREERLRAFQGYQVTEALCAGSAKPGWKFMHCLPRKGEEVDDEVFYGPRSLVFPEAANRKWTIMALFDLLFGKWDISVPVLIS